MIHIIRCPWIKEEEEASKTVGIYKELIDLWPIPGDKPSLAISRVRAWQNNSLSCLKSSIKPSRGLIYFQHVWGRGLFERAELVYFLWNGALYCFPKQSKDGINGPLPRLVCGQNSLRAIVLFKTTILGIQVYKFTQIKIFDTRLVWR